MQYFATHYWQSGEKNGTSLVLQQAYHKRRKMPVLLACIVNKSKKGGGDWNRFFSQKLVDWFYGKCLKLCGRNGEKRFGETAGCFKEFLERELQSVQDISEFTKPDIIGVLCVGHTFLIFQRGRQRISLLNSRNLRPNCCNIPVVENETVDLYLQTGILQKGVGILLATEEFQNYIGAEVVAECLNVKELHSRNQVDKHLQELGDFAKLRGGVDLSAVLVVTR